MLVERVGEMHPRAGIQADALELPLGVAEDGPAHLAQLQGRLVEQGVLGVVLEAVGDHQVEVPLQVGDGAVGVSLQLAAHGGEVHGLGDELQVVGDLGGGKESEAVSGRQSAEAAVAAENMVPRDCSGAAPTSDKFTG